MEELGFVESTKEASRGGFQGVKKVRGFLTELKKVPPRFTESDYGEPKEQIEFTLEDASILEMFLGEEEFELTDGRFSGWVSYAAEGKRPHANSAYMKCWVASAEAMGKKPSDFVGQYVTLEKIPTVLFKRPVMGKDKKPVLDEDGGKVYEEIATDKVFCFVPDEAADSQDTKGYVRDLVCGLTERAALRKLLLDIKAKQFPEFRQKLDDGTLTAYLDLVLIDGKFQKIEDPEEGEEETNE